VEIIIGLQNVPRELTISSSETAAQLQAAVAAALGPDGKVLNLTDDHGRTFMVPSAAIGFVEIGAEGTRHIGFGAG
jgi:hypothetical protein